MRKRHLAGLLALLLTIGGASVLPAGATHVAADESGMDILYSSQNTNALTNSDLAFWGDHAYAGNYNGFRIFDISDPSSPTLVEEFFCNGRQGDVSVWDRDGDGQADILFLSVDDVMEDESCTAARKTSKFKKNDWEGIRVIDISDPESPFIIDNLYQDCGSHTHTLVPDPEDDRVLLYNASYSLRSGPTCGPGNSAGRDPLHGVIQVSEVSWDAGDPLAGATAVEIAEPPINYLGDSDNKFEPSQHGFEGFNPLRACHDIAVFMELHLVAGACVEQAQLWAMDPVTLLPNTVTPLWTFDNPEDTDGPGGGDAAADFWHSATFTWDGKIVNFSDESFGEGCPPVTNITDPDASVQGESDTGRTYFLRVNDGALLSDFMIPRPDDSEASYCSTHQGNAIPTREGNQYFLVQAWYTGGVDLINFSNPTKPKEVAWFDYDGGGFSGSDNWAHYWYEQGNGEVKKLADMITYGQDGVHAPAPSATGRGFQVFDVFAQTLSKQGRFTVDHLNPQTQESVLE